MSLHNSGNDVFLIGRKLNDDNFFERPYKVKRFNMFFKEGFFFYMFFNIRLFLFLVFSKCDVYLSNDLDTLLANFLASKINKKPIVYDSHELFTEVPELINKNFIKSFWVLIEKLCFPNLKYIMTVSEGIASYYKEKYKKSILVIKNVPFLNNEFSENKESFNLSNFNENQKNIIYQGSLNKDRGISLMIDAMQHVNANLFIFGGGDLENKLKRYVIKKGLDKKIFFIGRVPFQRLKSITKKFDLGLSFEKDTCLSYRFSLPNKIFDYVHAEIPVLASNLPDISKFINENHIGEVLMSRKSKEIANQITIILNKKKAYGKYLKKAKNNFCWEQEEVKIINLFNHL